MAAVLSDVLDAVHSKLISLTLAGIEDGNICRMKVPVNRAQDLPRVPYPAIIFGPFGGEDLPEGGGTNLADDIGYPVALFILAKDEQDQTANADTYFLWREQIRQAFHNQRLTGASTVYKGVVTPQAIVDGGAWFTEALFVSSMLLKFTSRENRP